MVQGPAVEIGQQLDPDQIARVDISRTASVAKVEVRVYLTGAENPHLFEFDNMPAAIAFYEQLWARRAADDGEAAASHTA